MNFNLNTKLKKMLMQIQRNSFWRTQFLILPLFKYYIGKCNETLQELYNLIGCDLVELVQLDRGIIMAIDEEGKLKEIKGGFTFLGWGTVIAGTGIVLGGNSSKLKALQENLASFEMMTEWVDAPDVPPPHAFVTAFWVRILW